MMKKIGHLLLALFAFTYASAQSPTGTIEEEFTVGDYTFRITSQSPNEAELSGSTLADLNVPANAVDSFNSTDYSITAIGANAFESNTTITSVILPSSVVTLKSKAFNKASKLASINLDYIVTTEASALASCTSLPSTMNLPKCEDLGNYTFVFCTNINAINIPLATRIGEGALRGSGIFQMNIPSTVTTIGGQLFRGCTSLTDVQLNWLDPNVVTWDNASKTNTTVWNNIVPSAVKLYVPVTTKATYDAFYPWSDVTAVNVIEGTIPAPPADPIGTLFTIDDIEYKVTSVDDLEVEVASSTLAAVTVPASVTKLDGDALTYSVTAIGADAFLDNTSVTSVALPASVVVIKTNAFSGAVNLETINLENIVTVSTQNAFFNTPKLTTVNLAAATDIGNFAFHGLSNSTLTSISIPSAVNIGKAAFRTSQITSLDIPATVVTIADVVFMDCTALTALQVNWTTALEIPVILTTVFTNLTPADITLYVPAGTTAFYQAAVGWQDLTIVEGALSVKGFNEVKFSVYPNPISDFVTITSIESITNVTVLNASGGVVLNSSSTELDLSNFASGIYFVKVETKNGMSAKTIIKK
jgi:hypothetical protein